MMRSDYSAARRGARSACGRLLFAVLLQLVAFGVDVRGQSACPDEYTYTHQPPTEIVCNPYLDTKLMLDCAVTGSQDMNIQWYFSKTTISSFADDTVRVENSSKYSVTQRELSDGVGVSLTVNDLNEDNDTGMYWCQATVGPENTLLTQSGEFTLYGGDFYQFIPFRCPPNAFLRDADTRCAAVVIIEPEPPSLPSSLVPTPTSSTQTLLPPSVVSTTQNSSTFSSPTSTSLATQSAEVIIPPVDPTIAVDPSVPGMDDPVVGGSFIIYSILGVVGFLLVVCILLGCVIFFLCRKRRQKVDLGGYEKDNGAQSFDQDSAQSIVFRSGVNFKGRNGPNLSIAISSSSRSPHDSGDYAEIGPVLQSALRPNHTHYYSEIPELPLPRTRNNHPDRQSRDENPYDEPGLPHGFLARHTDQTAQEGVTPEADEEDPSTENSTLQGYQILERLPNHSQEPHTATLPTSSPPPPTSSPPPPPTSDNIETGFASPPVSPHSYHILEESLYCPEMAGVVGEDYLYPTITECSTSRLTTIPEHPYHILEEKNSTSPILLRLASDDTDAIDLSIKAATPDFVDLEVGEVIDSTSTSQDTSMGFEDREYDRLVDPRQLYHILERSSPGNRPRIRGLPDGYDRLDNGMRGRKGAHFLSLQTDTTISSLSAASGFSSEDSGCSNWDSKVFDDPQYIYSPKRKAQKTRSKNGEHEVLHPPQERSAAYSVKDIDLTKYCGNYERDPCYMARIRRMSAAQNRAKAAEDCTDYASYSLSSRFSTLSSGSSLPDITHVYQSLEVGTRDPLQPYEKLRRNFGGNEMQSNGI